MELIEKYEKNLYTVKNKDDIIEETKESDGEEEDEEMKDEGLK